MYSRREEDKVKRGGVHRGHKVKRRDMRKTKGRTEG